MAIIKLVSENDLGNGLAIENQKVVVKVDDSTVKINAQGQLTAVAQVDVKLQGASLNDSTNQLHLELSDGSALDVDLSKFLNIEQVKPTGVTVTGDKVTITLSDGTSVEGTLADFKNALHNNQLQTLGGVDLGYTIS